jgi:DivIVA domain-containing protein
MPLTPADIHNVTFSKPSIGKRGYKEDEVDVFLDLVGAELARLIEINKDLRNEIERLDQQLRTAPVGTGPTLCPLEAPPPVRAPLRTPMREMTSSGGGRNVQTVRMLNLAQEMADRLMREAKAEADRMLGEARAKSEQLLSNAGAKGDGMVNQARARAETMLNDARTGAETLDRQSRENAASRERDSVHKHAEIVSAIAHEKIALEQKIEELRTFDREYRTHLQTYLNLHLRKLDGRGAAASADMMRTQQDVGAHRLIPSMSTTGADLPQAVQMSVGKGLPDEGITNKPDTIGTRWQPAV